MLQESLEGPQAVARRLQSDLEVLEDLARELRARPPAALPTIARGSSDHAASYLAYLVMARLGWLVASLPMSLVPLNQAPLRVQGLVALAFSQSGRRPDLPSTLDAAAQAGARSVAFVNDPDSPLARAARWVFALHAGAEHSVAATESYIAQRVAGARLVAA